MVLNENSSEGSSSATDNNNNNNQYECNICLDTAKDAVISLCGHLFCWPCLFQWLETRPNAQTCPVCKSSINKEKVIPLYGRNSTSNKDPREKVPPRPSGQRTEVPRNNGFSNLNFDGFQVSFGIGAFPFSFLASTFNFGSNETRIPPPQPGTPQALEEQFLSRIFLIIAIIFIILIFLS